jgi:GT2 family glycosyltransferase
MKKVSVILLNWNGMPYIEKCVESVFKQTCCNDLELIVVDNGSSDGSLEIIREYDNVILIRNSTNLGFAGGMNAGIKAARGEYILPLNLDVYLREDYIENALKLIENDPYIACVGGIEYLWGKEGFVDIHLESSGPYFLKKRIQIFIDKKLRDKEVSCFGVTGSFPLIRMAAVTDLVSVSGHFFDPLFETGWEDTDVRFRLFWRGWKTVFSPRLVGWHVGSGSADAKLNLIDKPYEYQKRIFRNRAFVISKFPRELSKRLKIHLLVAEALILPYYFLISPRSAHACIAAKKDLVKYKNLLSERQRNIQKSITADPLEVMKFFQKF